jgi:hypothetical protein
MIVWMKSPNVGWIGAPDNGTANQLVQEMIPHHDALFWYAVKGKEQGK